MSNLLFVALDGLTEDEIYKKVSKFVKVEDDFGCNLNLDFWFKYGTKSRATNLMLSS